MYRVLVLGSCLCPLLRGVPTPHRTQQGEDGGTHLLTGTSRSQTWGSSQSAPLHLQAGRVWFPSMVGSAHCGQQCREGLGTTRHFCKCSPWVPDTTSGTSQQASQLGLVLWCFRQIGAGGPQWGKEVAKSLLCPWQYEHTTASCGAEGSL